MCSEIPEKVLDQEEELKKAELTFTEIEKQNIIFK